MLSPCLSFDEFCASEISGYPAKETSEGKPAVIQLTAGFAMGVAPRGYPTHVSPALRTGVGLHIVPVSKDASADVILSRSDSETLPLSHRFRRATKSGR